MSVVLHLTCSACDAELVTDLQQGEPVRDLVDLTESDLGLWLEVLVTLPEGWRSVGTLEEFRAWCPDHAAEAEAALVARRAAQDAAVAARHGGVLPGTRISFDPPETANA